MAIKKNKREDNTLNRTNNNNKLVKQIIEDLNKHLKSEYGYINKNGNAILDSNVINRKINSLINKLYYI